MTDEMLTIAEAARRMGISGHMIREIIDAREIQTFKPHPEAKRRKIWASELERYVESKRGSEAGRGIQVLRLPARDCQKR